jgi:tetratricopeptide (TPR) repeat protein
VAALRGQVLAWLNLGNVLCELGLAGPAVEAFKRGGIAGDPTAARAAAEFLEDDGRLAEAERFYRLAMPDDLAPAQLARVLRVRGRAREAEEIVEAARFRSDEAAFWYIEWKGIAPDEAIELLEFHVDRGSVDSLIPLANLYERVGRADDAIGALERSFETGERVAPHNLGLVLRRAGRRGYLKWILLGASEGDEHSVAWLKRYFGPTWRPLPGKFVRPARRPPGSPVHEFNAPQGVLETLVKTIPIVARSNPTKFESAVVVEPNARYRYSEAQLRTARGIDLYVREERRELVARLAGRGAFKAPIRAPHEMDARTLGVWLDGIEAQLVLANRSLVARLRARLRRRRP